MSSSVGAVLVTGCSSGIGEATAALLARQGHTVYATARNAQSLAGLQAAGCRTLSLDVTDEDSRRAAVDAVVSETGAVGALVNNAGYSQSGALETLALDDVRRQFETNVFGLLRMCQLVLPSMRQRGKGRIVNVSSMGGELHLSRRRLLPRHQVRRRGVVRRPPVRGRRLRRRRDGRPAGNHPDVVQRASRRRSAPARR